MYTHIESLLYLPIYLLFLFLPSFSFKLLSSAWRICFSKSASNEFYQFLFLWWCLYFAFTYEVYYHLISYSWLTGFFFPFQHFNCHSTAIWPPFLKISQLLIVLSLPCIQWVVFLLLLSLLLCFGFHNLAFIGIGLILFVFIVGSLSFLDLFINVFHQFSEFPSHYFFIHFPELLSFL